MEACGAVVRGHLGVQVIGPDEEFGRPGAQHRVEPVQLSGEGDEGGGADASCDEQGSSLRRGEAGAVGAADSEQVPRVQPVHGLRGVADAVHNELQGVSADYGERYLVHAGDPGHGELAGPEVQGGVEGEAADAGGDLPSLRYPDGAGPIHGRPP